MLPSLRVKSNRTEQSVKVPWYMNSVIVYMIYCVLFWYVVSNCEMFLLAMPPIQQVYMIRLASAGMAHHVPPPGFPPPPGMVPQAPGIPQAAGIPPGVAQWSEFPGLRGRR